jgi:serine/threonine-protein kinase
VQALDTRSRAERLRDEVAAVADSDVLATPAGRVLREAFDDRFTIRETWDALNPMDRQLVPDVIATAEALLERITALATSLARLDGAVAPDAVQALDERIAAAETAERAGVPEAERRLSLLRRQRASMTELAEREATMQDRLERASLALRSLRFDVVKLRALGVGATVNDVSMATQEARAVSVDIDRALDVASELRRL